MGFQTDWKQGLLHCSFRSPASIQVIFIWENGEKRVNAKSIMGMMSLGLDAGEKVTVSVEGADEEEAMKGIEEYLSKKSQK